MLKKFLSIALVSMAVLSFTACSDDDPVNVDPTPDPEKEDVEAKYDYTVIFWGMAGGNEQVTLTDLTDVLCERENGALGDNVRMVGVLKTSPEYDPALMHEDLNGTWSFDMGEQNGAKITPYEKLGGTSEEDSIANGYRQLWANTDAQKIGTLNYPLNNVDSLANFIKKSAEKYPAKHYILMTYGHGTGYNPAEEVPNADAYTSRSCVIDSYSEEGIIADDLVAAVTLSGVHIQTLFCQNCLMATLENLAAYQHCADYAIASSEATYGNYMQKFVAGLSSCKGDDDQFISMAKSVIDYYADTVCEKYKALEPIPTNTSHGFYDLSQVSSLLDIVKDAATWYANAAQKDEEFIGDVVEKVNCAIGFDTDVTGGAGMEFKMALDYFMNNATDDDAETSLQTFQNLLINAISLTQYSYEYGFIFSDLLRQTLENQKEATASLDFSTLQSLYNQYLSQIKKMAYIRCNYEDTSISDYPYIYCSPSVNIFAMNEEHYFINKAMYLMKGQDEEMAQMYVQQEAQRLMEYVYAQDEDGFTKELYGLIGGCTFAYAASLPTITSYYTGSQFDQATKWSEFLKHLNNNPSIYVNPVRIEKEAMAAYLLIKMISEEIGGDDDSDDDGGDDDFDLGDL